jgi:hypothetical protein
MVEAGGGGAKAFRAIRAIGYRHASCAVVSRTRAHRDIVATDGVHGLYGLDIHRAAR